MNQRKATPANGIRLSASATVPELLFSHAPESKGSAGTERRNRPRTTIRRTEKTMPATAAAFGVRRLPLVRVVVSIIALPPAFQCRHGQGSIALLPSRDIAHVGQLMRNPLV